MLSSGFGWIHVLDTAITQPVTSELFALKILDQIGFKTSDIRQPTTFINVAHPEVTTPLIIIVLPAGFTLLGLIKEIKKANNNNNNTGNRILNRRYSEIFAILTSMAAISILGILSHPEFYLFIIIVSILPLIFKLGGKNYHYIFASFLFALTVAILIDFAISPVKYYTAREILGVPLIALCFLFVIFTWILYTLGVVVLLNWSKTVKKTLHTIVNYYHHHRYYLSRIRLALGIIIVSVVAYFYLFTFIVWGDLSYEGIRAQAQIGGHWDIPWYLYPMKFGLIGLLGLAFILSYIFKKFEKEVFVFGVIAIIALLVGPYYDEHRCSKYIMASMAAFAALLIYEIISYFIRSTKLKLRPLISGILLGFIITLSGLSIFMFAGYIALLEINNWNEGSRRDFPSDYPSEMHLLKFLRDGLSNNHNTYNVVTLANEYNIYSGLISKIEGFSAIPRA